MERCASGMVTARSAKPNYVGSIPTRSSTLKGNIMKSDIDQLCEYIKSKRDGFRHQQRAAKHSDKQIEYKSKADILETILQEAALIKKYIEKNFPNPSM